MAASAVTVTDLLCMAPNVTVTFSTGFPHVKKVTVTAFKTFHFDVSDIMRLERSRMCQCTIANVHNGEHIDYFMKNK